MLCRISHCTTGLSPKAMNRATTTRISTELAWMISPPNHHASSAPADSRKPVTKGEWFHGPR